MLTVAKLSPLLLLVLVGAIYLGTHMSTTVANFTPFAPLGFGQFEAALVVIFWAYAGFEFGVIPSDNVENPQKTIPKAMVLAMTIIALFYVVVNIVAIGAADWTTLANSQTPLITAANRSFPLPPLGVAGPPSSELARFLPFLAQMNRAHFHFPGFRAPSPETAVPRIFDEEHAKYHTPYKAMIIQSALALGASLVGGLNQLILFSVFNLAFHLLYDVPFHICATKEREDGNGSLPDSGGFE